MNRFSALLRGFTALGIVLAIWPAWADNFFQSPSVVTLTPAWSASSVRPGDECVLAVVMEIAPGYHINPDESQLGAVTGWNPQPTVLRVTGAEDGVAIGQVQYAPPEMIEAATLAGQKVPAYENRAVVYVPVTISRSTKKSGQVLTVTLTYQACDATSCYPQTTTTCQATLHIDPQGAPAPAPGHSELFAGYRESAASPARVTSSTRLVDFDVFGWKMRIDPRGGIGLALLLFTAAIGGFLLNFTPCVLPMIPIKIMGLSRAAGHPSRCLALGMLMAVGVVGFWLVIGLAMATVTGFQSINQLFQYPAFTIGVGLAISLMAVGMCGLFAVRLPQWVYTFSPRQDTATGAVGFGVMTAVLSTPCTAPFMGAAAAWAVTQSPGIVLATFGAIGTGMALPYLLLAAFPRWIDRVPRTGPASELVKQVMGLLMLAAGSYFVGAGLSSLLVTQPDPPSHLYWWVVAAFIASAGLWLVWRTLRITARITPRMGWGSVGLTMAAAALWLGMNMTAAGPIDWINFTPERLADARSRGDVVVMDFTAEWCLNCKALEHSQLNQDRVATLLNSPGVTPIKVDITHNRSEPVRALFAEAQRVTIPLLVVFDREGRAVFKSDSYTAQQVVDAITSARRSG